MVNIERKQYDQAEGQLKGAAEIFERLEAPGEVAVQVGNLGYLKLMQNKTDEAEEHFRQALDLNKKSHRPHGVANMLGGLGEVERAVGNHAGAGMYFEAAVELEKSLGRVYGQAHRTLDLARALLILGTERKDEKLIILGNEKVIEAFSLAEQSESPTAKDATRQTLTGCAEASFNMAETMLNNGHKAGALYYAKLAWREFDVLKNAQKMDRCHTIIEAATALPDNGNREK